MKAIDKFLTTHGVDVGKSFALLTLNTAVVSFYTMAMQLILGGNFFFNLGAPLGIILGAALWQHKAWSRILLLIIGWIIAAIYIGLFVAIPFRGTPTLFVGTTVVNHPPVWKAVAAGILLVPCIFIFIAVLYSDKAKEEFNKRNRALESTDSKS